MYAFLSIAPKAILEIVQAPNVCWSSITPNAIPEGLQRLTRECQQQSAWTSSLWCLWHGNRDEYLGRMYANGKSSGASWKATPRHVYERIYCARGDTENRLRNSSRALRSTAPAVPVSWPTSSGNSYGRPHSRPRMNMPQAPFSLSETSCSPVSPIDCYASITTRRSRFPPCYPEVDQSSVMGFGQRHCPAIGRRNRVGNKRRFPGGTSFATPWKADIAILPVNSTVNDPVITQGFTGNVCGRIAADRIPGKTRPECRCGSDHMDISIVRTLEPHRAVSPSSPGTGSGARNRSSRTGLVPGQ